VGPHGRQWHHAGRAHRSSSRSSCTGRSRALATASSRRHTGIAATARIEPASCEALRRPRIPLRSAADPKLPVDDRAIRFRSCSIRSRREGDEALRVLSLCCSEARTWLRLRRSLSEEARARSRPGFPLKKHFYLAC